MPVFWLNDVELAFPHPSLAEPGGLLAVGGDLSPERLVLAYQNGIFPWFEEDEHFYWYSPDPRFVLFPNELRVHKSMRPVFNQKKFRYSLDTAFVRVIQGCAEVNRNGQRGSWISEAFVEGYVELHRRGIAHSVEVWDGETLAGGLYGLSMGRLFFGESMFTLQPNASKAGFIVLVQALERSGFWLIDCQQQTRHLASLGARSISRDLFLDYLVKNRYERSLLGNWEFTGQGVAIREIK